MDFKKFLKEQNTVGTHNDYATTGAMPSSWTGSEAPDNLEGRGLHLPSTDGLFPKVVKRGVIKSLGDVNQNGEPTKDPIVIRLSDGTTLALTWDQYKRIGKPKQGWMMTASFLRDNKDTSSQYSKIHNIETQDPNGQTYKFNNWPLS